MVHFSERTTAVVWVDALGAISRIRRKFSLCTAWHLSLQQQSRVAIKAGLGCTVATST